MSTPEKVLIAWKEIGDYLKPAEMPEPPLDTVGPPYGVLMTLMTIFGLNWDGSDDKGDEDGAGHPLRGAWGAVTHNKDVIGCALPIKEVAATFGGTESSHIQGYTVEVYSQVTQKTVKADIVDMGPAAHLHRLIDGTYGLHVALGHIDYGLKHYPGSEKFPFDKFPAGFHVAYWIVSPDGKYVEIKGVDFGGGRIIGS